MKQIDVEAVKWGIENQGFDYYMEHYAKSDLEGTAVWPRVQEYLDAKWGLEAAFEAEGILMED